MQTTPTEVLQHFNRGLTHSLNAPGGATLQGTRSRTCPTCHRHMSARLSYCSPQCRPACTVEGCQTQALNTKTSLCSLHDSRRRNGRPDWRTCTVCGTHIEDRPRRSKVCLEHTVCSVEGCERTSESHRLCSKHAEHMRLYGTSHTPCATCGKLIDLGPGRRIYCSESCRPACIHPTCDRPAKGAGTVCDSHRVQLAKHGELKPDRWAKDWVCVVCGKDVARGSGRRKHCSASCQQLDSRYEGSRPTAAECCMCGREFSLMRRRGGGRIQRADTRWCRDCARSSPEATRLHRYGVTPERYAAALLQGCDICRRRVDRLDVDHDHECCPAGTYRTCGACVRGFLCNPCNRALGMLGDDRDSLRRAIDYLSR